MQMKRGRMAEKAMIVFALVLAVVLQVRTQDSKYYSYAAKTDTGFCRNTKGIIWKQETEMITTGTAITGAALTGWVQVDEKWQYYENGILQEKEAGWYKIENKYYYLKEDGSRVEKAKGFYYIGDKWKYLLQNGEKLSKAAGWYKIEKKWYYIKRNGSYDCGWKTINGKTYYFGKKGMLANGWIKVGKKQYYQTKKKGIYKNQVIKDSSNGKYYFVDENGKKIDNKLTRYLVKVYRYCTTEGMTREGKLYAMYMYLATPSANNKYFRYERRYDDYKYIGRSGWTLDYAYQMLSTGKGNCYRFACCFGYFARMLGYDSYVQVGKCSAIRGGYTPHSWVEIKINGVTYVFDPELQFAGAASNLYKKTYGTYPITIIKGKSYKIKF